MNFFDFVSQDWKVNKGNSKGRLILILFRMANFCSKRKFLFYIGLPYLLFYRILVEWVLSVEIPWDTKIGPNLSLFHGQALVLNNKTIIGAGCTLRHSTTIGNKQVSGGLSGSPVIDDHVDIGSNVCIIGGVYIGNNVVIGCGSVIVKDVPPFSTVTGNPGVARVRKIMNEEIIWKDEQIENLI